MPVMLLVSGSSWAVRCQSRCWYNGIGSSILAYCWHGTVIAANFIYGMMAYLELQAVGQESAKQACSHIVQIHILAFCFPQNNTCRLGWVRWEQLRSVTQYHWRLTETFEVIAKDLLAALRSEKIYFPFHFHFPFIGLDWALLSALGWSRCIPSAETSAASPRIKFDQVPIFFSRENNSSNLKSSKGEVQVGQIRCIKSGLFRFHFHEEKKEFPDVWWVSRRAQALMRNPRPTRPGRIWRSRQREAGEKRWIHKNEKQINRSTKSQVKNAPPFMCSRQM